MLITFLRDHLNYKVNDTAEYPEAQAHYLVRVGAAEYYEQDTGAILNHLLEVICANEGRVNLNATFVIPVFHDHRHRMQNMLLTLAFIRKHFNAPVIISEQGGNYFEFLSKWFDYTQFSQPYFHRTRMINEMVMQAQTPVVINWDCDNICNPQQIIDAVKAFLTTHDISYPFEGTVVRVPRLFYKSVSEDVDVSSVDLSQCLQKASSVGHAVVMNKQSFIDCGMENEHFISWGPEDSERYNRYRILGLDIHRSEGKMFHMDHFIGENSSGNNRWFGDNNNEFYKIEKMNREQLKEYISNWSWVNKLYENKIPETAH